MKQKMLIVCMEVFCVLSAFARHPILVEDDICTITNRIIGHYSSNTSTFFRLSRYQEERDIWDKDFAQEIIIAVDSLRQSELKRGDPASSHRHWAWRQGVRYLGEMNSVTAVATNFLVKTMATGYPHEIPSATWAYFRLMKYSQECFSMARKLVDDSRKRPELERMQLIGSVNRMIDFSIGYGKPSPMVEPNFIEYAREWISGDGLRAFAMLSAICVAKPGFEYSDEWMHYARLIVNEPLLRETIRSFYRDELQKAEAMKKEREQKPKEAKP